MRCFSVLFFLTAIVSSAKGDALSVGPFGINSEGLGLNGSGVAIGQIENGRPGKPLKDNSNYVHEQTVPTQVYAGTAIDSANSSFVQGENGLHATQVAGVMIASAMPVSGVRGVAPAANLHAAAFLMNNDDAFAVAANRLAGISNLYAINISGGRTPQLFVEFTDGNTHITQFVDWSSSRHDVLYVVSGAQEGALVGLPQDNFNGITVAASDRFQGAGETWRQEASFNVGFLFDAVGDRTSTDLLAPGVSNFLTSPGDLEEFSLGTSFAAPHVTGAAALLHQYANTKIAASLPRWGNEAHFHEVTKAILLNSADKLNGVHGSERDVVNELGHTWLATLAYSDDETSLDQRLGAGHLNVESAIANFESGEYDPGLVPPIGWDFGGIGAFGDVDYTFNQSVSGYVAITLAWDRRVELTDPDNSYSSGDLFFDYVELDEVLNDLNVYLLPANTADLGMALTSSRTVDDNLEHIFYEVPAGNYKIKVLHSGGLNDAQDYALAWWAGELSPPVTPGDFDEDGDVDGADFLLWQRNTSVGSLTDWQANYGTGVGPLTAATAVPEPCAAILGSRLAWLCAAS